MKNHFPIFAKPGVVDQPSTAKEAMRRYCASRMTGMEIAEKMKLPRTQFSELVSGKRVWTPELADKFLKAVS